MSKEMSKKTGGMPLFIEGYLNRIASATSQEEADSYKQLYKENGNLGGVFENLTESLKKYEVNLGDVQNRDNKGAWDVLSGFVNGISTELQKDGIALFVYGSMQYDDPRNLDIDILATTRKNNPVINKSTLYKLQGALNYVWKRSGYSDSGYVVYQSFEELQTTNSKILDKDAEFVSGYAEKISMQFDNIAILSTGIPIFSPDGDYFGNKSDNRFIRDIRNDAKKMMKQNWLMSAGAIIALQNTLDIREERRKI